MGAGRRGGEVEQRSLTRLLGRPFAIVGAGLLALMLIAGVLFCVGQLSVQPRLARDQDASDALGSANAGMLDQETGLRAYVVSRDQSFLQPYIVGSTAVTVGDTTAAADLGAGNPATAQLLKVEAAEHIWEISWASLARDNPSEYGGAKLVSFLAEGKVLFDRYRRGETRLESMVSGQVRAAEADEQSLLVTEGLLVAFVLLLLIQTLWGQRRRLTSAISPPVKKLLQMMHNVEAGTGTVMALTDGPAELVELSAGLARMAGALDHERRASAASEARAISRARQLSQVLQVAREVSGNLNLRYVLDAVARGARALGGCERVAIWLIDDDGMEPVHVIGEAQHSEEEALAGEAARYGRVVRRETGPSGGTDLAVPMIVGARVVGAIVVSVGSQLLEGAEESLDMLATHAATAVEAARLHLAVQDQARVDALTRLPNRRQLDDDLANECVRASRYGRPVSFVMVDVDHFKKMNDTYGHQAGDALLQRLAQVLRDGLRSSDGVYRYGGEEFAMLLPETPGDEAGRLAERLRKEVEAHFGNSGRPITASFGVADDSLAGGADPGRLIAAADAALYAAKRKGRNQVVVSGSFLGSVDDEL